MPLDVRQFWQLLAKSQLYSVEQVRKFASELNSVSAIDPTTVAKTLVEESAITKYHAKILLAGRPGPFVFGDYLVIGADSTSHICNRFRAKHRETGHPVILEFLDELKMPEDANLSNLAATISSLSRHSHPSLAKCYEFVELPSHQFSVHASPTGPSLARILEEGKSIPIGKSVRWIHNATQAVSCLHQSGIAHGNISLDSIFVAGDSQLAAFPFAMFVATESQNIYDATSKDLRDLGVVLLNLLMGKSPDRLTTPDAIATLPGIPGINDAVIEIVKRMVAERPTQFESARDAATTIAKLLPARVPQPAKSHKTTATFLRAIDRKKDRSDKKTSGELRQIASVTPKVADAPAINAPKPTHRIHRRDNWIVTVSLVTIPLLLVAIALISLLRTPAPQPNWSTAAAGDADTSTGPNQEIGQARADGGGSHAYPQDDGQSLWATPTNGNPIDFSFVPAGTQMLIYARPQEILESDEGDRVFRALGPRFLASISEWQSKNQIDATTISALLIAVTLDINNAPQIVTRVDLAANAPDGSKWSRIAGETVPNGTLSVDGDDACLRVSNLVAESTRSEAQPEVENASGSAQRIIIGPKPIVDQLARSETFTPNLRREFEDLLTVSDESMHFTMLLAPNFLLADGKQIIPAAYSKLPNQIDTFFGPGVRALMFSSHFAADTSFFELRLESTAESKRRIREQVPNKFATLSDTLMPAFTSAASDIYWRTLAERMPSMIDFVASNLRTTMDGTQFVLNASLPETAAHNLVLGTELAAAWSGSSDASVRTPTVELSIEEVLNGNMSFAVNQQSLEFAVRDFSSQISDSMPGAANFVVKIVGADLQLDGITRNQQIRGLNETDKTVAELLTILCQRANPVTAATANHPDQKLVWVVAADPDNPNNRCVLLTTRQAASVKGFELPVVFRSE